MKNLLLSALTALSIALPSASAFAQTGPASYSRYVAPGEIIVACTFSGNGLNLRNSIDGYITNSILDGQRMYLLSRVKTENGTWFLVRTYDVDGNFVTGWVKAAYGCPFSY